MTALSTSVFEHLRRSVATEGSKIIVNEFGELKITADVLDVIQSLNSKHPIVKLLEEHVKYIYTRCHISSPLPLLLLLSLVERSVALIEQYGISPYQVEQYWQQLIALTRQYTSSSAVPPDATSLLRYSAGSLSAALALPRDTIAHLSRTAVQLIGQHCHVLEVTGARVSAEVLHHVTVRSATCPRAHSELRVLCVSGALEHVIAPLLDALVDLAPDLLLCLALDPTVNKPLARCGITTLVVTSEQLTYLATMSGGTIQTTIDHVMHCDESQLGHVTRIETESDECLQQYLVSFSEFPTTAAEVSTAPVHEPITVLIRAPHPALSQQCRRALFDTAAQLTRVNESTVLTLSADACHALAQLAPTDNELLREVWTRAWLELPLPRASALVLDSHVLQQLIESALHTALKILRVDQVLSM